MGIGAEYSIDTQIHLVLGLLGLYNFICLYEDIENEDQEANEILEDNEVVEPFVQGPIVSSIMDKRQDKLANDMWEAYCMHIGRDI